MLRRDYQPLGAYGWPPPPLLEVRARWLRWLGLAAIIGAVLALVAFVIDHDDPQPGLSVRAWLTLGAAAVLLVALGLHYRLGALALLRAVAQYAVVALLAVLLTLTALPAPPDPPRGAANRPAAGRAPAQQSTANRARPPAARPPANRPADPQAKGGGAGCPAVVKVHAWLACLWRHANPPAPPAPQTRRTP
jgi:hypothetical protein